MPNNGTLRLPLDVVGLHDDEIALDQPEDPVPPYTTEAVDTSSASILPATTPSAEKPGASVGVNPVEDEPKRPTRPATPEATDRPQPTEQPPPEETQQEEEPQQEAPEESEATDKTGGGSWWDSLKSGLDWVKDKFNGAVDKVTEVVNDATG